MTKIKILGSGHLFEWPFPWFPPGLENLEKWEGIFQSGKSQGILLKILEKSEKNYTGKLKKYFKSQGNLSASNSENPTNMVPYFK